MYWHKISQYFEEKMMKQSTFFRKSQKKLHIMSGFSNNCCSQLSSTCTVNNNCDKGKLYYHLHFFKIQWTIFSSLLKKIPVLNKHKNCLISYNIQLRYNIIIIQILKCIKIIFSIL